MATSTWLAACSTVLGLNDYDVDPSLEPAAPSSGGEPAGGVGSAADAPISAGEGGAAGSEVATFGGEAGAGGAGGATPSCTAADCDDTIDCTVDACSADGQCTHTPQNEACDGSRCEVCTLGIGCVAGDKLEQALLVDSHFDQASKDWHQTSDRFDQNIFPDPMAQSPGMIAKFGPAAADATDPEYADLLQYVTIPDDAVSVTLKGYYKLQPGTQHTGDDDYVVVGLWDLGSDSVTPYAQLHVFNAGDGAQSTWEAFSYSLTAKQVKSVSGSEYTFDLVANAWDSVYQFDTLELSATLCK